jgi:RNA polymerase sigma factor (sigma-70 family)
VHDYQLQLVPALLRQSRPDLTIGFFLHIPFPPFELFTQLPWRSAIVEGLLGADLVGFQRPNAATNFVQLARRLHELPTRGPVIEYDGREVAAAAFPISIDVAAFDQLASSPEVLMRADEIRKELGIDQDQLDQLRRDIDRARIDSLDRPVRTSGDGLLIPLSSTVFDEDDAVEHRVDEHELLGYLRDGVGLLPERHRTVVVGYFFEGRSMTELGALLGVTQSRASQIKEEAIRMLRHALDQAYRDEGDQERSLTERERAFAKTMAAARPWRDRLAAGKGFMAIR